MILVENLSLFNIESFKKLYNANENAYICDKDFFEIYNDECFILRYIIRKQIKLFKIKDEYIGYVWYEYPSNRGLSNIYALYVKDEYLELIDISLLASLKSCALKFDATDNLKTRYIMNKLQFNSECETILMRIASINCYNNLYDKSLRFKHFKKKKDEKLRCDIQNSIFNDKGRTPLTINDIYAEEEESYYIDDYSVFLYNDYGDPVGYGQIIYNKGIYTIVNFGILSQHRNKGYGETLVKYLIKLCYEDSIDRVYIRVEKTNYIALALYNKIGFTECGLFTTWYKGIS
ncbi:GNAT family N-acetyltransferase [Clostridium saccharobutylicum]|uniref:Ribosomal-protein-alanine N-acetyltransferase n=1 Tax=Clostridium saccharobutylicum TaxID=169679 RepID=A0A1S8N224_CLOSA|nr:GNAT family N-acetyltransferase [Clostridium saccharobutylicum]OOM10514.1 ribosomal-protein-alanine N-acetyltransferase [Clostridium saccharobutylicum]